jgi:hypothetical protein
MNTMSVARAEVAAARSGDEDDTGEYLTALEGRHRHELLATLCRSQGANRGLLEAAVVVGVDGRGRQPLLAPAGNGG